MRTLTTAVFLLFLICCAGALPAQEEGDGATIDAVIDAVREALVEAQTNNIPGFPDLAKVGIELQTVVGKGGGFEINLLVLKIGSKFETESASTIKLSLEPPVTREAAPGVAAVEPGKLKSALAQAINTAKQGVQKVNAGGEPKLDTAQVKLVVKFTVKTSHEAGAEVTEILPIGLKGTKKLSKAKIHAVELIFGKA